MTHLVMFFNGPPGSGKDTAWTAVEEVANRLDVHAFKMKFADPLKAACHHLVGMEFSEADKDVPQESLQGKTPRELYIGMSEKMVKPFFGTTFFGDYALRKMENNIRFLQRSITVFTDSGFREEAMPIMARFGVKNCAIISLSREGKTFAGDSRGYWDQAGCFKWEINNDSTLSDYYAAVAFATNYFVRERAGEVLGQLLVDINA